jgi:hypothetical protein
MATKFTYTETEVQEIVTKYQAGVALEELATQYAKSVPSVRMKLVKLGVYQKLTAAVKSPSKTTGEVFAVEKYEFPKTKAGVLAQYNTVLGKVGYSPF